MHKNIFLAVFVLFLKLAAFLVPAVGFAHNSNTDNADNNKLNNVLSTKEVRVCAWPEYYSISFLNPRDYTWSGIDIDLANLFAQNLGVELKIVHSSFDTLIDDVIGDKCDVAMYAIGINEHRQKYLRFTSPHLSSDVLAITTKNNRKINQWQDIDKKDNVVSVLKGSIHEQIMLDHLKHANISKAKDFQQREKDVESGRADVFITDYPYAVFVLDTNEWANLISPPNKVKITDYAWALAPGNDDWYNTVENFMRQIKQDGSLMQSALKYGLESIVVID